MFNTIRLCCFDTHCILGIIQNVLKFVQTIASTIFKKRDKSKSSRVIQSSRYEERKIWGDSPKLTKGVHQRVWQVEEIPEERRIKPESILELQQAAKDIANTILAEMLRDAAQNVRKRAQACIDASGGHF